MYSMIKDISALTEIPEKTLEKIKDDIEYSICYDVKETLNTNENISVIDLGFGTLSIMADSREVKYKFIPSESLETKIIASIKGQDVLTEVVEKSLKNKIISTYKEFF